jgi:hypothetical protein
MTDIARMAREAGCFTPGASRNYWAVTDPALQRFAELVRAQERERCAKVCEAAQFTGNTFPRTQMEQLRMDIAAAIRST